jgi:hypothetical protein
MEGISGFDVDEDFYEDDEPVEKIMVAFTQGRKFVTARPITVEITGPAQPAPSSWPWPVRISLRAAPAAPIILARI